MLSKIYRRNVIIKIYIQHKTIEIFFKKKVALNKAVLELVTTTSRNQQVATTTKSIYFFFSKNLITFNVNFFSFAWTLIGNEWINRNNNSSRSFPAKLKFKCSLTQVQFGFFGKPPPTKKKQAIKKSLCFPTKKMAN